MTTLSNKTDPFCDADGEHTTSPADVLANFLAWNITQRNIKYPICRVMQASAHDAPRLDRFRRLDVRMKITRLY
jgi:hypothetical protein